MSSNPRFASRVFAIAGIYGILVLAPQYFLEERLSRDFAAYLLGELKLKKGDRVAIMMPNCLQYPIAVFGVRGTDFIVEENP